MKSCTEPLRIGIVTDGLEERPTDGETVIANGGVGVYVYNLVKHLRLVDALNEYHLIRCGPGRLDIYGHEPDRNIFLPASKLTRLAQTLDRPYRRIAAERQLDLLHYPNQFGGAFLPRHIKRVVTLHDVTPLLVPRYHPWQRVLGYRLLMRRALRRADHVIVDSRGTGADLVRPGVVPANKVTVIPLGADDRFKPGVRTADFPRRYELPERFILTVGVLEPRKNHALLVAAVRRLHERGARIGLVIVGRDGWNWRDPLDAPGVAHLRSWVRIFRNVSESDLVEFYNRAEIFAYPSLYEGFGLPIVEAMGCGTPVVTSKASCLPEVAGDAALLADPTDAEDFAAKLLAVLGNPALHDRLAAAGIRRARELSWRRTAQRTLAVYERVCGRPAPARSRSEADLGDAARLESKG